MGLWIYSKRSAMPCTLSLLLLIITHPKFWGVPMSHGVPNLPAPSPGAPPRLLPSPVKGPWGLATCQSAFVVYHGWQMIYDTHILFIYLSIHPFITHTHTCIIIYIYACLFAYTIPEKGGRKPAPSRNLFGSAKKCRGSLGYDPSLPSERCLHVPFFSHLSLLCNPSPLLPRYHPSSPCKLSCSEPQRTLLSVELRILSFSNMLASMFLVFSKLCLSSISCLFFKPFPAFSYGFSRVSFPQFPRFPNSFLNFPWFFQVCHSFFPPF